MKKIIYVIVGLLLAIFPFTLKAVTAKDEKIDLSNYKTLNFKDILKEEEIKEAFKSYSETDDQVPIYLFRGNGCSYCRAFLSFLNNITEEYGKYFKVVGFEVWYDTNNSDLLNTISDFMGDKAGGVPYIIIGDNVFPGYASDYDSSIKNAIIELYDSKDRYDVFKEYNKAIDAAKKEENSGTVSSAVWSFIFVSISTVIIILYVKKSNKDLLSKLVEEKYKPAVKNEAKTVKEEKEVKPTKTVKTKKTSTKSKSNKKKK